MSHVLWELQYGHTKELCTKCQYVLCTEGIILCHIFYLYLGIWLTSEENHGKLQSVWPKSARHNLFSKCGHNFMGTEPPEPQSWVQDPSLQISLLGDTNRCEIKDCSTEHTQIYSSNINKYNYVKP
jgi:hypothetical protein